jgi:hypothetical protein
MNLTDRRSAKRALINAPAPANPSQACWRVRGGYQAGDTDNVLHSGLTYRQACAIAKSLRAGGAYAQAERATPTDAQWMAALGPCGR